MLLIDELFFTQEEDYFQLPEGVSAAKLPGKGEIIYDQRAFIAGWRHSVPNSHLSGRILVKFEVVTSPGFFAVSFGEDDPPPRSDWFCSNKEGVTISLNQV